MPYYQQGPEDYYGPQSGFDPYSGRLQSGNLIMQFLNQMAKGKENRKKEQWDIEDREWQKIARDLDRKNAEASLKAKKLELQDYRTQAQKDQAAREKTTFETNEQIRQEAARIEAQGKISERLKKLEIAKAAEDLEYSDKKQAVKANQKTRQEQGRLYALLVKQIEQSRKTLNKLALDIKKAENDGDEGKRQILMNQAFQAKSDLDSYEAQRQAIISERLGINEEPEQKRRQLPSLPQKDTRSGFLGIFGQRERVPVEPKSTVTSPVERNGDRRKIRRDGKELWQVFDGAKWVDE